eukprot:CAMPEP_0118853566 /NCGR_PEP_ID=MMETSP1163-20130328/2101_1 /TAXON_ID=124430 /ORGANISM="Phaeomonas parva, Strain CCMP2877" /LENGTH=36 /DNA_ID= /DNA_START= /DNA_END= /DNA_ORIENTATION=
MVTYGGSVYMRNEAAAERREWVMLDSAHAALRACLA